MRIDPIDDPKEQANTKRRNHRRVNRITRIVAIILAALSTYTLIIKIVFF